MTVARRRLIDLDRRRRSGAAASDALAHLADGLAAASVEPGLPDQRLALLFACAHPALEPGDPRAADAAGGARARRRPHRLGLPGLARGDGQAAGARQDQDPAGRHPLRHPRRRRAGAAARRGARGDLRRLRRRLDRRRRCRRRPPRPDRRGDLSGAAGHRPDAGGAGSARPPRADAARRGAPAGPPRRRGRLRAARLAGPAALGRRDDRRGRGAAHPRQRPGRHRPLPARRRAAIGACPPLPQPAAPTGRGWWRSTTRCSRSPPRRWWRSTAPSPSASAMAPPPASPPSTPSPATPASPSTSPTGPPAPSSWSRSGATAAAREAYEIAIGLERDPAVRSFLQNCRAALEACPRHTDRGPGRRRSAGRPYSHSI